MMHSNKQVLSGLRVLDFGSFITGPYAAMLLAALHNLRRRGARVVEIGLWRQNAPAMNLYISLGFKEAANWYYLACDVG